MSLTSNAKRSGQGTVEFILVIGVVVVGVTALKNALVKPLNEYFSSYTQQMRTPGTTGGRSLPSYYQEGASDPSSTAKVVPK